MDAIIVLIGLAIGVAIFLALMNSITAIVYNCTSVAITFGICWAIGIVLAWIAWKIALIIGIIALIIFIIGKVTGAGKKSDNKTEETQCECERQTEENE
ncbi:MAG: hypothetical protein IKU25_06340 [Clostridia bacterium]|nr:hypothetical protein [Clostridia bacterium]